MATQILVLSLIVHPVTTVEIVVTNMKVIYAPESEGVGSCSGSICKRYIYITLTSQLYDFHKSSLALVHCSEKMETMTCYGGLWVRLHKCSVDFKNVKWNHDFTI